MAIATFTYCRRLALRAWRTMAPLRYAAKFDPFLSLDCAPRALHPPWRNPKIGRNQIFPSGNYARQGLLGRLRDGSRLRLGSGQLQGWSKGCSTGCVIAPCHKGDLRQPRAHHFDRTCTVPSMRSANLHTARKVLRATSSSTSQAGYDWIELEISRFLFRFT